MDSPNLKPVRSTADAQVRGSAGGRKSGESRRKKKELRERLELLLKTKKDGLTVADALVMALVEKGLTGDVRAFEVIRDTLGQKPANRVELPQGMVICWHDGSDNSI